jgi:hypothetical protein
VEEWHGGSEYDDTDDDEYSSCSEDPGQHDDDDSDDLYADASDGTDGTDGTDDSDGSDGTDADADADSDGSDDGETFFYLKLSCISWQPALLPSVSARSFKFFVSRHRLGASSFPVHL